MLLFVYSFSLTAASFSRRPDCRKPKGNVRIFFAAYNRDECGKPIHILIDWR